MTSWYSHREWGVRPRGCRISLSRQMYIISWLASDSYTSDLLCQQVKREKERETPTIESLFWSLRHLGPGSEKCGEWLVEPLLRYVLQRKHINHGKSPERVGDVVNYLLSSKRFLLIFIYSLTSASDIFVCLSGTAAETVVAWICRGETASDLEISTRLLPVILFVEACVVSFARTVIIT